SLAPASPATYPLSLHDALPILGFRREDGRAKGLPWLRYISVQHRRGRTLVRRFPRASAPSTGAGRSGPRPNPYSSPSASPTPERSEEHTSELQSRENLVCRLLL